MSKYIKPITDNIRRQLDIKVAIRNLQDELLSLQDQLFDLRTEFHCVQLEAYVEFTFGDSEESNESVVSQWEQENPGWKVTGRGLEKVKP